MNKARTRIAPSPTGYMHIGTLHTALFNYFLAKKTGGQFLLRIEDTDRTRFVEGAIESMLKTFERLGLEFDEGPKLENSTIVQKGECGPYIQSQRLDIYKKYIKKLLDQGDAYQCFCTKERLEKMRAAQIQSKQTPKYDRACLSLTDEQRQEKTDEQIPYVVRMHVPVGETRVNDLIRGEIIFANADIDDQVLLKSDGYPTYHLAVVIDDFLMHITHVVRGEEWLPSTPKHILLQQMLGFDVPLYAHLPLLLNADKSKLSKRQGDVAVEDYLNKGYLPEALLNFIGTLGFNPTGDRELYSLQELIDFFEITQVKKSGAVMNLEKLNWMNNQYIQKLDEDMLMSLAIPFLPDGQDRDLVKKFLTVERSRLNTLSELKEKFEPYCLNPQVDPKTLIWKGSNGLDAKMNLESIACLIDKMDESIFENLETIEIKIKKYIEREHLHNGNVLWPLRVALSGREKSASPFEFLWVLGKDEAIRRVKTAINLL